MSDLHPLPKLKSACFHVSSEQVSNLLSRWAAEPVTLTDMRPLLGGQISLVLEVQAEADWAPVVLKLAPAAEGAYLEQEWHTLHYFREHTSFPVPNPLGLLRPTSEHPYYCLILERLRGNSLGAMRSRLLPEQHRRLQVRLAGAVSALHGISRPSYGLVTEAEGFYDWSGYFAEELRVLHEELKRDRRDFATAQPSLADLIELTPEVLEEPGPPCLTHGDLWAGNLIIHQGQLSGIIDPTGRFAPAEEELAYLELWGTVEDSFWRIYHAQHPTQPGYERRRLWYWLFTLMLHVWLFGADEYGPRLLAVMEEAGRQR